MRERGQLKKGGEQLLQQQYFGVAVATRPTPLYTNCCGDPGVVTAPEKKGTKSKMKKKEREKNELR